MQFMEILVSLSLIPKINGQPHNIPIEIILSIIPSNPCWYLKELLGFKLLDSFCDNCLWIARAEFIVSLLRVSIRMSEINKYPWKIFVFSRGKLKIRYFFFAVLIAKNHEFGSNPVKKSQRKNKIGRALVLAGLIEFSILRR